MTGNSQEAMEVEGKRNKGQGVEKRQRKGSNEEARNGSRTKGE
jgi:hypothetical protein